MFADKYGAKYEKAVTCLTKDRDALLAFFCQGSGSAVGFGRLPFQSNRGASGQAGSRGRREMG
jgi:hypothetical protein